MRIKVTFCVPNKKLLCVGYVERYDRQELVVVTRSENPQEAMGEAYEAACKAGGEPNKLMRYQFLD